ncbi:MAG: hypothetical protein M1118_05255 [Chloroflexi bacterium]|nr:hypothetical protein [Chloroflexota bacterium]
MQATSLARHVIWSLQESTARAVELHLVLIQPSCLESLLTVRAGYDPSCCSFQQGIDRRIPVGRVIVHSSDRLLADPLVAHSSVTLVTTLCNPIEKNCGDTR